MEQILPTYILGGEFWPIKKDKILACVLDKNGLYKPDELSYTRASKAWQISSDNKIKKIGTDIPRIEYKDNLPHIMFEQTVSNLVLKHFQINASVAMSNEHPIVIDGPFNEPILSTRLYNISTTNTSRVRIVSFTSTVGWDNDTDYELSFWIKVTAGDTLTIQPRINEVKPTSFDVSVADGWYFHSEILTSDSSSTYFGDTGMNITSGVNSSSEFYLTGMNLKQASSISSTIFNENGSVTRAVEKTTHRTNLIADNIVSNTEGTIYANILNKGSGNGGILFEPSGSNAIMIINGGFERLRIYIKQDSTSILNPYIDNSDFIKVVVTFSLSGFYIYIDGVLHTSSTTSYTGSWIDKFQFNTYGDNFWLREFKLFNRELSAFEIENL